MPEAEPTRPKLDAEDPYCLLLYFRHHRATEGGMIPHRQVLFNCINTAASWGLSEQDISLVFVPLFHAGGLFAFLTPPFYLGGRIILARSLEVEESLRVTEQEGCTVILGVPTIFRMWMKSPRFAAADFSRVRWFISGGAPYPEAIMKIWREQKGVVFRQGYGLTEVGPNCFNMTDAESVPKSVAVGKPIFYSEMRIVDESGNERPVGKVGELLIRGPHVCLGYWNNPQAGSEAILDGWFYTGDIARRDEEGFYFIVGRFKDIIISGGENIYAAEIEAAVLEHPEVAEAALIAEPDAKFGEVGRAAGRGGAGGHHTHRGIHLPDLRGPPGALQDPQTSSLRRCPTLLALRQGAETQRRAEGLGAVDIHRSGPDCGPFPH